MHDEIKETVTEGSTTQATQTPQPVVASKAVDLDKVEARAAEKARKSLLAELGIDDPAAAKTAIESYRKAEEARLSQAEKTERALKSALDGRADSEKRAAEALARAEAAEERARQVELFGECDVKSGQDRDLVAFLLSRAKEADKKLDERAFLAELKKERPYLFRDVSSASAAATTLATTAPQAPAASGTSMFGVTTSQVFDAMRVPRKDADEYIRKNRPSLSNSLPFHLLFLRFFKGFPWLHLFRSRAGSRLASRS